jgi:sec-independent protein translocase protein TatA
MGELSPWHLLILAAVFVVLFGSRKLPDAARSLGRSMRIFKAETKALRDTDENADEVRPAHSVQQPVLQQPVQQTQPQPVAQPAPVTVTLDDGTIVSGVPLAEAQRKQQST